MSALAAIVSGFGVGIFLESVFGVGWPINVFSALIAAIFAGATAFVPRRTYALGVLFLIALTLGITRAALFATPLPVAFKLDLHHRVSYTGIVVADPSMKDASQRIAVEVRKNGEQTTVLAVVPRTESVMVGERVNVSGTLLLPEPFADEGGRIFRYDKYLEKSGIRFILDYGSIRVLERAPWYSLSAELARLKHAFLDGLAYSLPEPYASLAGGIVIGGKSGLGDELENAFIATGLVQVIVLSGYNVMVVAEWVLAIANTTLSRIRHAREWAALAAALVLLAFVGIAGFSATAVRASLMALIALYARATGKSYAASRALLLVVLLMLVWNPYYLAFDPSFDLSVVATAGLIWLAPRFEQLWERFLRVCQVQRSETLSKIAPAAAGHSFWQNAVATTLAAQVAVLPLLLYETGNLSLVAIPANLLVMPVVPLAMGVSATTGIIGAAIGPLAPSVAALIGVPAYLLNLYVVLIARSASALPLGDFTLPAFPFVLVLAAYAALAIAASKRFSTTLQLRFLKKASM